MRYHTIADDIGITVNTDINPSTLTLTDERTGATVTIAEGQLGIIKLVRRGMADLFDATRQREREAAR